MEILIRTAVFLIFLSLFVHAEDSVLINAHIRMVPKIMTLNTVPSANSSTKSILGVIYEGNHRSQAQAVAEKMNKYHNGKISTISFNAVPISVDELPTQRNISFAYLTQMSTAATTKVGEWGVANSIPTFSYDVSALEHGVLGSIAIERTTVIYINKNVLKNGKFHFNDTLFQIARLIE